MPAKLSKQGRTAPAPMRREVWKVIIYYKTVSMDLTERIESRLLGADTKLSAQNAADQATTRGMWITNGTLSDLIPPHRILQATIYSEVVE